MQKELTFKQAKGFFEFINPKVLLKVSKGAFRIFMVTNPEKDEFNIGEQEIVFFSEAVKLLDFY